jgi:hypothetical protein
MSTSTTKPNQMTPWDFRRNMESFVIRSRELEDGMAEKAGDIMYKYMVALFNSCAVNEVMLIMKTIDLPYEKHSIGGQVGTRTDVVSTDNIDEFMSKFTAED